MPVTDLSYAARRPSEASRAVMAVETRGWTCAWAVASGDLPRNWGLLTGRDHVDGKPIPASHRVGRLFAALVEAAEREEVVLVVAEPKSKPGPIWTVAPLLAVARHARYAEIRDWMDELGIDGRSVRSWATLVLGKPPEDESVAVALGLAAAGARLLQREVGRSPSPAGRERLTPSS